MSATDPAQSAPPQSAELPPQAWQLAFDPPRALGVPPVSGVIRSRPEDFVVDEELGFEPDGEGPHWLLRVRKRGANTEFVARQLAAHGGVPGPEVGFAGLKDRHAVTTQWFTVPRGKSDAAHWLALQHAEFEVLEVQAHRRKLKRGALAGNRFELRIREVHGDPKAALERIALIGARGVPNYFGPQRFGRGGSNLHAAQRWAAGGRPPRSRSERGFALSAARSLIFNATLAARVQQAQWDALQPGDVANLEGSGSVFAVPEVDDTLRARIAAFDIHPTAALWGRGPSMAGTPVAAMESAAAEQFAALARLLEGEGLSQERRSTRLAVRELVGQADDEGLHLSFRLPAGAFATTVLRELAEAAQDADRGGGEHD